MAFGKKLWTGADRRIDPRVKLTLVASAYLANMETEQITVRDLSPRGFRALLPDHVGLRAIFRIALPGGRTTHAQVVRIDEDACACEFLAPLEEEQFLVVAQACTPQRAAS